MLKCWLQCSVFDKNFVSILRKENELAVLIQYIDRNKLEPPAATFLDIILYSREQIRLENLATGDATADTDAPWGIISVKVRNAIYDWTLYSMDFTTISELRLSLYNCRVSFVTSNCRCSQLRL